HRARWPEAADVRKLAENGEARLLESVAVILSAVRRAKSEAKLSMKAQASSVVVTGQPDALTLVERAADDLRTAGNVVDLVFSPRPGELAVSVTLASPAA